MQIVKYYDIWALLCPPTPPPSVFQCLINDVLQDMLGKFVIAYVDDILIYSPSLKTHVKHVRQAPVEQPAARQGREL